MCTSKYFTVCLALASLLASCAKSDSYDIQGDQGVKFFLNNNPNFGNLPDNSIGYNAVNIPNAAGNGLLNLSATIPASIKFPVFATRPVAGDVVISAVLDNTLVADYNAAHNTNYVTFPEGVLNASGLSAHMAKGTTTSADSITITADPTSFNKLTEKAYMAPIRLTSISDAGAGALTTTTQVTFIVANVEQRRIKYLATAADAIGALLTPRTAWTAIFDAVPTTTGSIFDGLTTTYNKWAASPVQVDVNIQAAKNVTGIRLYTASSATYVPTQMDVYLSNDGVVYDYIGSPLKANLTYASSYNYILFYKAIPAQYIRLKLYYSTSTNTQNLRLTEFDVYAN